MIINTSYEVPPSPMTKINIRLLQYEARSIEDC